MEKLHLKLQIIHASRGASTVWFVLWDGQKEYYMTSLSLTLFRRENNLKMTDPIEGDFTIVKRGGRESLYPIIKDDTPICCGKRMKKQPITSDTEFHDAEYIKPLYAYNGNLIRRGYWYKDYYHCKKCDCYK